MSRKVRSHVLLWAGLPLVLLLVSGCTNTTTATCPQPPSTWTVNGVQLNPADYPVAPRAANTSIDLSLEHNYIAQRLKAAFEAPPPGNPNPTSGVFVNDTSYFGVLLDQAGTGGQTVNRVTVTILPWLLGANGTKAPLTYSYRLHLKIVPYLVTPSTVPDPQKRRNFLGNIDSGAALRFEFLELDGGSSGLVSCSNFNLIDAQVLGGIYTALAEQTPLVLPADKLTSMVAGLTGSTPTLVGMNVGSSDDLKIGLTLNQGSPQTFDPNVHIFQGISNVDWAVNLDPSFLRAKISGVVAAGAAMQPDVSVTSTSVSFADGTSSPTGTGSAEIDATAKGTLNKCKAFGTIHWTANVTILPLVRKRADGKPVLFAPNTQTTSNDANILNGVCVILDQFFQSIANPLGSATVTIGGVCSNPVGDPLQFDVGTNDQFYGTDVATLDGTPVGAFQVAGRSTFIDQLFPGRPPVPSC